VVWQTDSPLNICCSENDKFRLSLSFVCLIGHLPGPEHSIAVHVDPAVPSNAINVASEEIISFHNVDIVTPSQKLLAIQLSCDVSQGKSLLVTGI